MLGLIREALAYLWYKLGIDRYHCVVTYQARGLIYHRTVKGFRDKEAAYNYATLANQMPGGDGQIFYWVIDSFEEEDILAAWEIRIGILDFREVRDDKKSI